MTIGFPTPGLLNEPSGISLKYTILREEPQEIISSEPKATAIIRLKFIPFQLMFSNSDKKTDKNSGD